MSGINKVNGKSITGLEHIKQSIADILTTPLGSRVMRRTYGSAAADLIDQPLNPATLLQLYSASVIAIAEWEPRVRLERITRVLDTHSPGRIEIHIDFTRLDTGSPEAVNLSLSLPSTTN